MVTLVTFGVLFTGFTQGVVTPSFRSGEVVLFVSLFWVVFIRPLKFPRPPSTLVTLVCHSQLRWQGVTQGGVVPSFRSGEPLVVLTRGP